MASTLFVLAFALVMTGIGWSVITRLDAGGRLGLGETAAISFLSGCFTIYFGVFAVGYFRLDGLTMWSLAGLAVLLALPGLRRMPWADFREALGREIRRSFEDKWGGFLWLAAISIAVASLLQALAPPNDYDSLMYHLAYPRTDIEIGRFTIDWARDSGIQVALFPALMGNLTRFALATMNDGVAQMIHGLFGVAAAIGTAAFVTRLGFGRHVALAAAVLFLAIRVVVWEMGTVEVDVPLAAFTIFSMLVYWTWREDHEIGLAIVFGLMIGAGILTKYHGLPIAAAFAALMIWDKFRRRIPSRIWIIGPLVALAIITPHLIRNFVISGNPLFPLFNSIFNPGDPVFFVETAANPYGVGLGFIDLLVKPWRFFVLPMHHFDGMIFGAPYLFVLAPMVLLDRRSAARWGGVMSIVLIYYLVWAFFMGQQVRFLLPIMPVLAGLAAVGAAAIWRLAGGKRILQTAIAGLVLVMGVNQALFVGVYSGIRLPVAVGLMTASAYHANTPTLTGAKFQVCNFIRQNLGDGERYFSLASPHSYYCPQASVTWTYFADEAKWWLKSDTPPEMSRDEFVRRVEKANFRFFMFPKAFEKRRNDTGKPEIIKIDISGRRFGNYLAPVLAGLSPVAEGPFTLVYDGRQILARLQKGVQP